MKGNSKKLICYETRKSLGDQILNDRKNGGFLCEVKFVTSQSFSGEQLVYHLKSSAVFTGESASDLSSNTWTLTHFTVKNTKRLSPSRVKVEYDTKRTYLGFVDNLEDLIKQLLENYKLGRVMVGPRKWANRPSTYTRALYYKQAKHILRFENKSRLATSTDPNCPIHKMNPTLIKDRIDFGEYCLEAWGGIKKRKTYTYITFSQSTRIWLDKVCRQVTL